MIPARGPLGEPLALPVDLHAINTAASPAVRHDAMSWEGREGTEDTTGQGGNRDGRQPADSRSVAGFRRGPDGHRVAPADPPPAPAAPVTSAGARALHMNHICPARCRHSGRLRWLTWPAAVRGHSWVFAGEREHGHGEVHGRAQRIHRPDRGPAAPGPLAGPSRSTRRARVIWIEPVVRGPAQATRIRMGVCSADRAGAPRPVRLKNLFVPNETWCVRQDLSGAGGGPGRPGSP